MRPAKAAAYFSEKIGNFFLIMFSCQSLLIRWLGQRIILFLPLIFVVRLPAQTVLINEIVASNSASIKDEDGDSPDWVELYNAGSTPVNLKGFGLTDDKDAPLKWIFPEVILDPHDFLLIFASDKNRKNWLHWETVIVPGDVWRYRPGTSAPPVDWRRPEFNDANWNQGPGGFGYEDGDDATVVPRVISLCVRKSFTIADKSRIAKAWLHIDYDDAFVAYLNDVEIARANIGAPGDHPTFNQSATTFREALMYQGGAPDAFALTNLQSLFRDGENVLAIQVHNYGIESSDLSLIPFLSIGFSTPPDSSRGTSPFLPPFSNQLHTNFKISADGERVSLFNANRQLLSQINPGPLPTDISFGRQPDGSANWFYFNQPTPGLANTTPGYSQIAGEPTFSFPGGFYQESLQLTIKPGSGAGTIYYTLDGSMPTTESIPYHSPISISRTTVVRAREIVANALLKPPVTHTYFLNENIALPVISLTTNPPNLWDPDSGIYVLGRSYEPGMPNFGANFWEDWERPVHVEFFEPGGQPGFQVDAGLQIFGGWSRYFAQKSLAIFARGTYGAGKIVYPIFPDKPIKEFEAFILRNSGNDWRSTLFRDGLMQSLLKNTTLDLQAYRPAVIFLNGAYWGIQNIREKINEHFVAANSGVDPDDVDLLEYDGAVIEGENTHYLALLDYLAKQDPRLSATYDSVKTLIDVDNFLDYQIAQIYFDNQDWPGNNIKFWRPRTPGGRWRWLIFDTDYGFGLLNGAAYRNNTLEFATATNGPDWPNPPWSTFLLRRLLENAEFKTAFINRFADHLNATFLPGRINQRIDEIKSLLEPEIPRHRGKWSESVNSWTQNVQILRLFANYRPTYVKSHLTAKFKLKGLARITLQTEPAAAGQIRLNSLHLATFPWQGDYFQEVPVELEAIPAEGYRFTGWRELAGASNPASFTPGVDATLTAVFEKTTGIDSRAPEILSFSLAQNYPNPFNNSTLIQYSLPEASQVSITIYNMTGQELVQLENQLRTAGVHRVTWEVMGTPEIATGIYFCHLMAQAGKRRFHQTIKILYLK